MTLAEKLADMKTTALSTALGGAIGGGGAYLKERERQHAGRMGMDDMVQRGQMRPEDAERSKRLGNRFALHKALVGGTAGALVGGGGAHVVQKYGPGAVSRVDEFLGARAKNIGRNAAEGAADVAASRGPGLARDAGHAAGKAAVEGVVGAARPTHLPTEGGALGAAGEAAGAGAARGVGGAMNPMNWFKKTSSAPISTKIAGTIRKSDFDAFEEMFKEAEVSELIGACPTVRAALSKIASRGVGSKLTVAGATKLASRGRFDVVQVRPTEWGYLVKWAAAPDGVQPQQQEMTVPQAQQALPPEMLQAADQQGVATTTGVEAEPDPLAEHPAPVEGFGLYKVHDVSNGNEIVGFVIPQLFDPFTGQPSVSKLFVNGSAFALQPDIAGVLVSVTYNLPAGPSEPRGMGIFYKTDGKGIIATVPFIVQNAVTVEGARYYAATTMEGAPVQITPSDGIRRPVASSPGEVAMPVDYVWLPLNGQIELQGAGVDPMAQVKQASFSSSAVIRAWPDGYGGVQGVKLTGPVFEKVGAGDHDCCDALFFLAAAGMPQNLATAVIEKAASTGEPLRMYGLRVLSPDPTIVKEAFADALGDLAFRGVKVPKPVCLLKEAMAIEMHKESKALVGVDSLDTLLSVGFINNENIQEFVDNIPQLEEASSKLAELVFATQLGLQSVPKTAAVRAMNSLEEVITGLKGLKTYKL